MYSKSQKKAHQLKLTFLCYSKNLAPPLEVEIEKGFGSENHYGIRVVQPLEFQEELSFL
jgi:hypothetical protein